MDRALINEAVRALDVMSVFLGSHAVTLADSFDPGEDPGRTSTITNWGSTNIATLDLLDQAGKVVGHHLRVTFRTRVQIVPTPESGLSDETVEEARKQRIAEIAARFIAVYAVKADAPRPSDKALEEFARHNVPLHVWPYWREFLQSTCARVGIPQIRLGMYRIRNQPPAVAEEPGPTGAQ